MGPLGPILKSYPLGPQALTKRARRAREVIVVRKIKIEKEPSGPEGPVNKNQLMPRLWALRPIIKSLIKGPEGPKYPKQVLVI